MHKVLEMVEFETWIKVGIAGVFALGGVGMSIAIWGLYQTVPLVAILVVGLLILPSIVIFRKSIYNRIKKKRRLIEMVNPMLVIGGFILAGIGYSVGVVGLLPGADFKKYAVGSTVMMGGVVIAAVGMRA